MAQTQQVCRNCGFVGFPRSFTKGDIGTEIVLWLLCLLPGIIYSVWRLSSKYMGCPNCKAPNMIPADSPLAQGIINTTKK